MNRNELLNDEYSTWGREGLQAVTYINQKDDKVLKLFKSYSESIEQLINRGMSDSATSREWHENGFQSNILASNKLSDETGILFYHDGFSDIGEININDKSLLTLHNPFVIQKKVKLVCECIGEHVKNNKIDFAKKVIDDVFVLIDIIWNKSITEDTFNYDHNYGYTDEGVMIQIDIGSFWSGDDCVKKQLSEKKMLDNVTSNWIRNLSQDLYDYHILKSNELYDRREIKI